MSEQLTLFAADTHASLSPRPGSDEARKMTATSGRNLVGSWLNSGPLGSLERMLLGTSAWASTVCFLTWKDRATPAGRLLFQLAPSVPRTDEIGAGLWPTAVASAQGKIPAMWPTPRAADHKGATSPAAAGKSVARGYGPNLPEMAAAVHGRMWPTPGAGDNRDRGNLSTPAIKRRAEKGKQLNLSMVVSDQSGSLNPEWVEWLMGFPADWTNLENE